MPQTNVKQTQGNGKFYIYLYPFRDITQGRLQWSFHMSMDQESFLIFKKKIKVNYKLIKI
jgi:hypothetical protein